MNFPNPEHNKNRGMMGNVLPINQGNTQGTRKNESVVKCKE